MVGFLLGPLIGGAATVVGGGMSMVGGAMSLAGGLLHAGSTVASIGAGVVGGLASAAGGMLGGGESGNVQRGGDGEDGGERVYGAERFGSKSNTAKTPGAGRQAIVIPQTSMTGSQSTDLASSEGSSPQEVLMSIFKSMQQSLISIDNTLRSMLGVDTATLAMEKKSATEDNLKERDTDKEKGPGFFSRVGSKVKGAAKRIMPKSGGGAAAILKTLGLAALITLFNKYKEEITSAIEKVIGYFFELEKEFDENGFAGVFTKISGDLSALGEKIMPVLKAFWNDTVVPMLKEFFSWALTTAKNIIFGNKNPTVEKSIDNVVKQEEKRNKEIDILTDKVESGEGNLIDEVILGQANNTNLKDKLNYMKSLTDKSRGRLTWTIDLADEDIPIEERVKAKAVVGGEFYNDTNRAVEAAKTAAATDFDLTTGLQSKGKFKDNYGVENPFDSNTYGAGMSNAQKYDYDSYGSVGSDQFTFSINDTIMRLRQAIAEDMKLIKGGRKKTFMGQSITKRIQNNQNQLKKLYSAIGQDNAVMDFDFKKFKVDSEPFVSANTAALKNAFNENTRISEDFKGITSPTLVAPVTNNQTNVSTTTQGQSRHPRSENNEPTSKSLSESPYHN